MTYSTVINGLKVLLPLLALGLMATVFLFGREDTTEQQLPFLNDLRERVSGREGMSASVFTGSTEEGDALRIAAATMRTDPEDPDRTLATQLTARIDYTDGSDLDIVADAGQYSDIHDTLVLNGNVVIESSQGYTMHTDQLTTEISSGRAESPGHVFATGPMGEITAGRMVVERQNGDADNVHLVFTNGVKLIYERQKEAE